MPLTKSDHHWHRIYSESSAEFTHVVDDAYSAVNRFIRTEAGPINGEFLKTCGDDRAEALVAAITRFVCECNPTHPAVIHALKSVEAEQ